MTALKWVGLLKSNELWCVQTFLSPFYCLEINFLSETWPVSCIGGSPKKFFKKLLGYIYDA